MSRNVECDYCDNEITEGGIISEEICLCEDCTEQYIDTFND